MQGMCQRLTDGFNSHRFVHYQEHSYAVNAGACPGRRLIELSRLAKSTSRHISWSTSHARFAASACGRRFLKGRHAFNGSAVERGL